MLWKKSVISSDDNETIDRAARMARRGRPVDLNFLADEMLYLRCANSSLNPAHPSRLFPDQIRFYPDQSVNRGKYSEPEDVLHTTEANLPKGIKKQFRQILTDKATVIKPRRA